MTARKRTTAKKAAPKKAAAPKADPNAPRMVNDGYDPAVPVESIHPHERNPNVGHISSIAESLDSHGFFGAVLCQRSSGRIIAGTHRWKAAQSKGMTTVPVIWADVDDNEALRILLADNQTARKGHDDRDMLAEILTELHDDPIGLAGTGYDDDFLAKLTAEPDPTPVVDTDKGKGAERYAVIVECADEAEQTTVAELVAGAGHGTEIRKVVDR